MTVEWTQCHGWFTIYTPETVPKSVPESADRTGMADSLPLLVGGVTDLLHL